MKNLFYVGQKNNVACDSCGIYVVSLILTLNLYKHVGINLLVQCQGLVVYPIFLVKSILKRTVPVPQDLMSLFINLNFIFPPIFIGRRDGHTKQHEIYRYLCSLYCGIDSAETVR